MAPRCPLVVTLQPQRAHLIQILPPLRVKYCPQGDWTAVVLMEAASEPLDGSVRQKAAMCSPGGANMQKQCNLQHRNNVLFVGSHMFMSRYYFLF